MLHDILQGKKALFADGASTVLRGQENRTRRVMLLDGNLVANTRSESRGISARVMKKGVYGFSSVASYTAADAERAVAAATKNAEFLASHAERNIVLPPSAERGLILPERDIADTEQKRIIEACRQVDGYLEGLENITSRRVVYHEDSQDKIIYTSDACDGHITIPRCYIYVFLSAEAAGGSPIELFRAFGGAGSFFDNFNTVDWIFPGVDEVHRMLMDKRSGVYAQAGLKTVIIDGMLTGMLAHEAVGHTVEADLVRGGSVAGPNLGKPVASELISLVDFAHTALGKEAPLPVFMDDEGTKAEDAWLIKDGILTGYMHSRESAAYYNMKPQGNARGWTFSDEPLIRMRNTAILPGKDRLSDMIASVDDGYYLLCTGNGQADVTGEFMFGINMGYEIRNGKLGRAILDTTVSGIAFEMLKTVDMVSDDMYWESNGFCGKKQPMAVGLGGPALRCKITIGGR